MTFTFLHLRNWTIFEQLELEEGLLRADDRNFFILSEGSAIPSIVMGISGKAQQHIDLDKTAEQKIPVIRRFSGGGTVIVDEGTIFVTFIGNRSLIEPNTFTAESIMKWAEQLLHPAFGHPTFGLKENDFVFAEKKCGGNAQYLQKNRWLLHTSFLWTYKKERMNLLLHPPKTPPYRQGRTHEDFICCLDNFFPSKEGLLSQIGNEMGRRFHLQTGKLDELKANLTASTHRRTTRLEQY